MDGHRAIFRQWLAREQTQKWLREFASIVLGVLVALTLGAMATQIGWWLEVRSARSALANELGEIIGQTEERVHLSPCVERRLDAIASILDTADRTGRLPPTGTIANPPWRSWPRGVWVSTVNAQTAAQMDRDVLDNYSTSYDFADTIATASLRELEVWTKLAAIVGPGRAITRDEIVALRGSVGEARLVHRLIGLVGVRLKQVVVAYNLGYDRDTARRYSRLPLSSYPICTPDAGPPPTRYGQAPLDGAIGNALANPITSENRGLTGRR